MDEDEELLPLKSYAVGSLATTFYIPNFITQSEQAQLLHQTYVVSASRWKSLKNRRLQNWGGVVHEKGLLPQDLPPWLKKLTERICEQTGLFPSAINHVLINEYLPEQGIMPHQDGPAYFPVVAILSLQSPVVIDFTPHPRLKECKDKDKVTAENQDITDSSSKVGENGLSDELIPREEYDRQPQSLLLMPRSLLIFKDQAYSGTLRYVVISRVNLESLYPKFQTDSPEINDCYYTGGLGVLLLLFFSPQGTQCSQYFQDYPYRYADANTIPHDYLHGIEDSEVHRLDKVANVSEIPKLQDTIVASSSDSAGGIGSSFHRTSNRASLTCRLVPKVHKKLFKF